MVIHRRLRRGRHHPQSDAFGKQARKEWRNRAAGRYQGVLRVNRKRPRHRTGADGQAGWLRRRPQVVVVEPDLVPGQTGEGGDDFVVEIDVGVIDLPKVERSDHVGEWVASPKLLTSSRSPSVSAISTSDASFTDPVPYSSAWTLYLETPERSASSC